MNLNVKFAKALYISLSNAQAAKRLYIVRDVFKIIYVQLKSIVIVNFAKVHKISWKLTINICKY